MKPLKPTEATDAKVTDAVPKEINVALEGQTISAAAAKLTVLAQQMDYHAVASGPRTYQLVRRRRQRMRLRNQTMTLTFVEDRAGPRVRVIGDIDTVFIEHLTGRQTDSIASPLPPPDQITEAPSNRVFAAPAENYPLPSVQAQAVRPAASSSGVISAVPGAAGGLASVPQRTVAPRPLNPPPSQHLESPPLSPPTSATSANEVGDDRTVKRDSIRVATPSHPVLVTPDGTTVTLAAPLVIGRNPDPSVGPAGSTAFAITDPTLSKSHCVVQVLGAGLTVLDLHSTNGTRIETGSQTFACTPGQVSAAFALPLVVWVGDVRVDVRTTTGASA